jgi:hypothetical protein
MINCRKVGVPARPDIYHQCHFQALASAPLGTKEKQSSFDDTDSHIHNYLQSPNVNPVQRALNVWSKLQDVSNAAMIIDEYPLSYLNHCSLLGHQWMLYALINNGAWNSFYDGSCLIYLLLLIEHISKSCEFTGDASQQMHPFWHHSGIIQPVWSLLSNRMWSRCK